MKILTEFQGFYQTNTKSMHMWFHTVQFRLVVWVHVMIGTSHASLRTKWSEIDLWPLAQTVDVIRVHTLDLSKALKNQGTETTSIWILKKRNGSRLARTCRCRLLNRDNTSSIFSTDVQMDGWLWKSMHISTKSKGFKDGRLQQWLMLKAKRVTEAHEWQKHVRAETQMFLTSFSRSMSLR